LDARSTCVAEDSCASEGKKHMLPYLLALTPTTPQPPKHYAETTVPHHSSLRWLRCNPAGTQQHTSQHPKLVSACEGAPRLSLPGNSFAMAALPPSRHSVTYSSTTGNSVSMPSWQGACLTCLCLGRAPQWLRCNPAGIQQHITCHTIMSKAPHLSLPGKSFAMAVKSVPKMVSAL
jgi:hypothetical protein